jgi:DNA topoisomerase-2
MKQEFSRIDIQNLYDEDYADYAIFRAYQRIPHLIDGFAQTQRKIIHTMIDKNIVKKMKVSDLASIVSLHTKYHHGNTSIESTISNLVPQYNNQLPLIREDGTYGCRSDREASAPRYIESRLFKYSRLIFNEIDNTHFVNSQTSEGHSIEPEYLIPVLPLLLINGNVQIGVGYSSTVLPREIGEVARILKKILRGELKNIPNDIQPIAPKFNGKIYKQDNGWIFEGLIKKEARNKIRITEVPPKYTRTTYIKILEDLKEAGKIQTYTENILGDSFDILITIKGLSSDNFNEAALINMLKLKEKKTENITILTPNKEIKKYISVGEVLYDYIMYMIGIYSKRKEYLLKNLTDELNVISNKIKFIRMINDSTLSIKNKTDDVIHDELMNNGFYKVDDISTDLDSEKKIGGFLYLLRMPLRTLTPSKITELENKCAMIESELRELRESTPSSIWLHDIDNILKEIKKERIGEL